MQTVTLFMTDLLTSEAVERTIDISNVYVPCSETCMQKKAETEERQREQLERWIKERGNEQHEALLVLDRWTVND